MTVPEGTATSATDVESGAPVKGSSATTTAAPTAVATPTKSMAAPSAPARSQNTCMANTSLVCAIVGLFIFGVILRTLAIIFGCIAKNKIKENPEEYGGECQANAGVTIGAISLVLWVIILLVVV